MLFKYSNFIYLFSCSINSTNLSVLSFERKKNYHRLHSMKVQIVHMGLLCVAVCYFVVTTGVIKYAFRNRMPLF